MRGTLRPSPFSSRGYWHCLSRSCLGPQPQRRLLGAGVASAHAATPSGQSQPEPPRPPTLARLAARQRVFDLIDGCDLAALGAAVEALIAENPSLTPGLDTPEVGVGVWEVFYAPHISRLGAALRTTFSPIRYTLLPGGAFYSNVRFSGPLVGTGWLSASGVLAVQDELSVKVLFRDFWVDRGDAPRAAVGRGSNVGAPQPGALPGWVDPLVDAAGRALFLPQLSVYPVVYLDAGLAVFQFQPLSSNIAVRRVGDAPGGGAGGGGGGGTESAA